MARGLARSRNQAARLIQAGRVSVDGTITTRPATQVSVEQLTCEPEPYVSRAAYKLLGALDAAGVEVPARVLDAGASTGGFTQVLLERGAQRVYAFDVGHDQLVPELRADPRVVVREGFNLRDLTLADLDGERVPLLVADLSFISLTKLLPRFAEVLTPSGAALLLIKPQFEVGRKGLNHGVVRSAELRQLGIAAVLDAAGELGLTCSWRADAVLSGTDGNLEHFALVGRT